MQAICTNEDKKSISKRTNIVDTIIYIERIDRCLERKHVRELGGRTTGI